MVKIKPQNDCPRIKVLAVIAGESRSIYTSIFMQWAQSTRRRLTHRLGMVALLLFPIAVIAFSCSSPITTRVAPGQGPGVVVRGHPIQQKFYPLKEAICSDKDLQQLTRLVDPRFPHFKYHRLPISLIYHAMRVWGKECPFSSIHKENGASQGGLYLKIITRNAEYQRQSRISVDHLLRVSDVGVHVVTSGDAIWGSEQASTHFGTYVMLMAEMGISADYPLQVTNDKMKVLEDVIVDHAWNVHLADENEWAVSGLARYLVTPQWQNRFGQFISFDDLVFSLVERPLGHGACYGTHVPYALTTILDVNNQSRILTSRAETAAKRKLLECAQVLTMTQSSDGSWGKNWYNMNLSKSRMVDMLGFVEMDRVITTGHTLEWLITCPPELRPNERVIADAVLFLKRTLPSLQDVIKADTLHWYLFVSHAVRALMLAHGHRWANQSYLNGTGRI